MKIHLIRLLDEAIALELNVAELYFVFYSAFPEDASFWWRLSIEEQNHGSLLTTARKMVESEVSLPPDFLQVSLQELKQTNEKILSAMEEFRANPDRGRAFNVAYDIENAAGEVHLETFMKLDSRSKITSVLQRLNQDDIDHARRIKEYMTENQIPGSFV